MNEKAKFATCLGAGAAVTGGIWFAAKLPFAGPHSAWFVLAALALAALAHTFELTRRNLQRTAGVVLLLAVLFVALHHSNDVPLLRRVGLYLIAAAVGTALVHQPGLVGRNLWRTAGGVFLLTILVMEVRHPGTLSALTVGQGNDAAFARGSVLSILNRHGELGIVTLGAGLLILTGGIDLSIGSLVALSAVSFGMLMERGFSPTAAAAVVVFGGVVLGVGHGLLVTQLGLQAFLVTLCGMFVYRGLARSIQPGQIGRGSVTNQLRQKVLDSYGDTSNDPALAAQAEAAADAAGEAFELPFLDLRYWLTGQNPDERLVFPGLLVLFLLLAAVAAVFLHRSAFGRYWYAIGNNEQAAKYAGVTVWKHKVAVFGLCSGLAALAGVVRFLSAGSVTPSVEGDSYELYAITAAVLGGVSLRGGEGTSVGLVCGALVLPVVKAVMNFTKTPSEWEPWLIGLILLGGAIVDETIRRRSRRA